MKIIFSDLGLEKKVRKVVEIDSTHNFPNAEEFILSECYLHFPSDDLELVPTDGLDLTLSRSMTIVYKGIFKGGTVLRV